MIPVVAIVGPTAVGKSALACELAEELNGEILSADSAQVYRGLDVGTAKPTPEERARIPHHLLDLVPPDQQFSLGEFQRRARPLLDEIHGRGRLPLVVGGSGLYVRGLLQGYCPPPPPDPELRRRLEALSTRELLGELQQRDPASAARIDPRNRRRLVRALEVCRQTGQPFSELARTRDPGLRSLTIGLWMARPQLKERIYRRVEWMVYRQGWLEEVRTLAEKGYAPHLRRLRILGYPQLLDVLEGRLTLEEAVARIQQATGRYARRQMTWFRRERDIRWLDVAGTSPRETARAWIREFLGQRT